MLAAAGAEEDFAFVWIETGAEGSELGSEEVEEWSRILEFICGVSFLKGPDFESGSFKDTDGFGKGHGGLWGIEGAEATGASIAEGSELKPDPKGGFPLLLKLRA